ncbi:MAG: sulfite exporter TauE/SafE family protein [Cyanobacteria bacterium SID2]|nr:sulfite exporter TauE/SafE family protein [Cyanobacteria bacterium SID2]MBP0005591.1 sulfite exporter TauE/SafE family protein [Cyanobacteria bacterium SBC]
MEIFTSPDVIWAIGHVLAMTIGLSLGLIGGGGSVLAVPVLIYVMNLPTQEAIATSLFVVGLVSLIGLSSHWQQGNVNLKIALAFAPFAMVGAYLGAQFAALPPINDTVQLVSFGIVMGIAGVSMIRKDSQSRSSESKVDILSVPPRATNFALVPLQGATVGLLTGFVGVGGGFAIVPALVILGGVPMKEAIGTSLLLIVFNAVSGFLGYIDRVDLDWSLIASFAIAASLGTLSGASFARSIDAKHLQKGFGYFVLAIAIFVLIQR